MQKKVCFYLTQLSPFFSASFLLKGLLPQFSIVFLFLQSSRNLLHFRMFPFTIFVIISIFYPSPVTEQQKWIIRTIIVARSSCLSSSWINLRLNLSSSLYNLLSISSCCGLSTHPCSPDSTFLERWCKIFAKIGWAERIAASKRLNFLWYRIRKSSWDLLEIERYKGVPVENSSVERLDSDLWLWANTQFCFCTFNLQSPSLVLQTLSYIIWSKWTM